MARLFGDPLLGIGRALILAGMVAAARAAAVCVSIIPLALVEREQVLQAVARELSPLPPAQ